MGVEFAVHFIDQDGDGLVSKGDHIQVDGSEPLRTGTSYAVTLIGSIGVVSANCMT